MPSNTKTDLNQVQSRCKKSKPNLKLDRPERGEIEKNEKQGGLSGREARCDCKK